MRAPHVADVGEPLAPSDPRFADGHVMLVENGRYWHMIDRMLLPLRETMRTRGSALSTRQTLADAARTRFLASPVIDDEHRPFGLLGWDDIVRFALAHGGVDPCWRKPARSAAATVITPIMNGYRLGPVSTVREVAITMLDQVPPQLDAQNDAIQCWIDGGIVTPRDLISAIFGVKPHGPGDSL